MDVKRVTIWTEVIANGAFIPVGDLSKGEPVKAVASQ